MKITPITNNDISLKGSVDSKIVKLIGSYSVTLSENSKLAEKFPKELPHLPKIFAGEGMKASKYALNIIKNLETIMSRFGKSCKLTYEVSKKNPALYRFMITSQDSDYVATCGTVALHKRYYEEDLKALDKFTDNLAKTDPYETNLKFRTMRHGDLYDYKADRFVPEKEICFIEDELVSMDNGPLSKYETDNTRICTIGDLLTELRIFGEKFKQENVLFKKFII